MRTMTYSESRAHYAEVLDSVVDDCEEVVITRAGHESAVIVSLAEWSSMKETDYLLRSPANARRLREAVANLKAGRVEEHDLVDMGDDEAGNDAAGPVNADDAAMAT